MRRWRVIGSGMAMLAGVAAAQPVLAECKVAQIVELPVTLIGRRAMVEAKFGTHDARFIVDSGAFFSTISRASATEFGLKTELAPEGFRMRGVNGDASAAVARTTDFSLSGIPFPKIEFLVGGSDTGTAGLLGQNILGLADVEYDLPHGAVRLMRTSGCEKTGLAYWTNGKPFSSIALERGEGRFRQHTIGTVLVNGVRMRAVFDSGAQSSVMTLAAAKRAGVTPSSPGVERVGSGSGLGSREVATWLAPFATIDLGGEVVPHPKFRIADIGIDADMLIGFDFFLTHRIFVSNDADRMDLTYEGGALFGVTPTGARTTGGARLDLTDTAATPTDAAGFARRGAVFMSGAKPTEGLADFDRAVALAPDNPRYRYLRAQARIANRQPLLAAADLDAAIAMAPDDADMRLARARMRLGARDPDGAATDLAVADRTLPAGSDRRIELAALFARIDRSEAALANYDAWLKLHAEDADRATAYNGRCWARALLGRDLDRALADCNAALKLRPGNPAYLDSRALVELRTGKLDAALADYDAAIAANPRNAWSLYTRGIVRQRLGQTDAAAADRKAALAIDPGVTARAEKYALRY